MSMMPMLPYGVLWRVICKQIRIEKEKDEFFFRNKERNQFSVS